MPAPFGRRGAARHRARAARRLRRAPLRRPGRAAAAGGPVLHAELPRRGGAGGKPSGRSCRGRSACSRAPAGERRAPLPDRGRRPRDEAPVRARARATSCCSSGRSASASCRPRDGRRAAARRRRRRDRAAGDLAGPSSARDSAGPCCSASATPPMPRGAALLRDPRLATDDGSVGHHGLVTELLADAARRGPARRGVRVRSAADARGGAGAVRRARGRPPSSRSSPGWRAASAPASAASSPTREGFVRLCVDGPVLDAAVARDCARRRSGALTQRAVEPSSSAGSSSSTRSSTPRGRSTRSRRSARSGEQLVEHFPFAAFVSKTVTLAPRQGNPPPAAVGARRRADQLDRAAEQGPRGLPRAGPARSSPSCRCR